MRLDPNQKTKSDDNAGSSDIHAMVNLVFPKHPITFQIGDAVDIELNIWNVPVVVVIYQSVRPMLVSPRQQGAALRKILVTAQACINA